MLATHEAPDYGPRRFHRSPPDRERAGSSVVEHSTFNRMVVSSNLTRPTKFSEISDIANASAKVDAKSVGVVGDVGRIC